MACDPDHKCASERLPRYDIPMTIVRLVMKVK
jgi:hypothetical protein